VKSFEFKVNHTTRPFDSTALHDAKCVTLSIAGV
jgi:hypothetical protein